MGRQGVSNGVSAALERGRIKLAEQKGKQGANLYLVHVVDQSENQSTKETSTSPLSGPQLVHVVDTQKKDSKESTKEKDQELSPSAGAGESSSGESQNQPVIVWTDFYEQPLIVLHWSDLADAKQPHIAIIEDGYLRALDQYGRRPIETRDPIVSRVKIAALIRDAGFTWRQVYDCVIWIYSEDNPDPFWKDALNAVSLEKVAQGLPAWWAKHKPIDLGVVPVPEWRRGMDDDFDAEVFEHAHAEQ